MGLSLQTEVFGELDGIKKGTRSAVNVARLRRQCKKEGRVLRNGGSCEEAGTML